MGVQSHSPINEVKKAVYNVKQVSPQNQVYVPQNRVNMNAYNHGGMNEQYNGNVNMNQYNPQVIPHQKVVINMPPKQIRVPTYQVPSYAPVPMYGYCNPQYEMQAQPNGNQYGYGVI